MDMSSRVILPVSLEALPRRQHATVAAIDWTRLASGQLLRRFGGGHAADRAERAKRAGFLLRRGFDPATVRAVTRAEVDDPGPDFD